MCTVPLPKISKQFKEVYLYVAERVPDDQRHAGICFNENIETEKDNTQLDPSIAPELLYRIQKVRFLLYEAMAIREKKDELIKFAVCRADDADIHKE